MLVTVDTGATKTLIWVFDKAGKPVWKKRFPTPLNQAEYVETLQTELTELQELYPHIDVVTVALPGLVKDSVLVWAGNLSWKNLDLPKELVGVLPDVPILVENDANLGGLGETRLLKIAPTVSLYVTISTGIGTGVTINDAISKLHSESGHLLLEFDGVIREWEDFASGAAIYKAYGKYAKDITNTRTWYNIAQRISRGFLVLIPVLQPDVIIIGGSIGTHLPKYLDNLVGILKERLPERMPVPEIVQAKHPEEAVIYGCYYYAIDSLADTKAR